MGGEEGVYDTARPRSPDADGFKKRESTPRTHLVPMIGFDLFRELIGQLPHFVERFEAGRPQVVDLP